MQGYFDLQIEGYAGVGITAGDLTAEGLHEACERLAGDGVAGILATFATDDLDRMVHRMQRLVALRERDPVARRMIPGFHIEGPFISRAVGYRGAHPAEHIRPPDAEAMKRLLDAGAGLTRIVTLAPERDKRLALTRMLADQGIVVSAGHCNPTLDQLRAALDAGLSMFTHLGNGCPSRLPRHDNVVQRVLSLAEKLWITFIADGVHIPVFALRNYLSAAGLARACVVTDAVRPAGLGPGLYEVDGGTVRVGEDLAIRAPDGPHLMGSAVTMPQNFRNLTEKVGLSHADALKLTCQNPRRAVGLDAAA
jgi:N-acetylglucosamine-6-phosphate deacetylase